ncbi:Limulus clotting factor C [Araneus ventricosus]|uniref:Limulus clotting factor C n=1 Tax=Araneus ventricosus TaxID=182803 RepID=A0A4Y2BRJ2_ARAVE|nr:Limulus clotting factor C [Araneus ventricosus]
MSTAAFWHCLAISTILAMAAPVSCLRCISCRCGSSNKNYTQCIENELKEEYTCNTWAKCQTCKDNTTHCINCPPKQFGPLCTGVLEHIRRKRKIHRSTHCRNEAYIHNGRVLVLRTLTRPLLFEEDDFELPVGTRLHYSCDEGYVLKGVADLICEDNGFWSEEEPPTCAEVRCEKFGPVSNGRVVVFFTSIDSRRRTIDEKGGLNYPVGTRLLYSCDQGYTLLGNKTLICESSGRWSDNEPLCTNKCGRNSIYPNHPAFLGTKTIPGEWPWTVAIAVNEKNTTRFYCSGVLINSNTVLTVAHCVERDRDYILYFGLFRLKFESKDGLVEERTSSRIIVHPNFNRKAFENDIALVIFKPPVRYSERIQPICLPTPASTERNLASEEKGFVSGWEIGEPTSRSQELSIIRIPVLSEQTCTELYRKKGITQPITPVFFCAGLETGIEDFCSMISGSPMVFYDEEMGRYTLEGLVSWGGSRPCEKRENYYVLTKVAAFMQWILDTWQT